MYPIFAGPIPGSMMQGKPSLSVLGLAACRRNSAPVLAPLPGYTFSDVAGTTPAVIDGTVACLKDLLGGSLVATSSATGQQPIWRKGTVVDNVSDGIGPCWLDSDTVDDKLITVAGAAYSAATVIKSIKGVGHITQHAQNISASTNWTDDNLCGLILSPAQPSAADLALMERYADWLAGGVQTLGPELVTNPGPFASTTGYLGDAGGTIGTSGGLLTVTASAAWSGVKTSSAVLAIGKTYLCKVVLQTNSNNRAAILAAINEAQIGPSTSTTGEIVGLFTPTAVHRSLGVQFFNSGVAGDVLGIASLSAREVIFS